MINDLVANSQWVIQNGQTVDFYFDNWLGTPLLDALPPFDNIPLGIRVGNFISNGKWSIPNPLTLSHPDICNHITSVPLPLYPKADQLVWTHSSNGHLTFKDAYHHFHPLSNKDWTLHL